MKKPNDEIDNLQNVPLPPKAMELLNVQHTREIIYWINKGERLDHAT